MGKTCCKKGSKYNIKCNTVCGGDLGCRCLPGKCKVKKKDIPCTCEPKARGPIPKPNSPTDISCVPTPVPPTTPTPQQGTVIDTKNGFSYVNKGNITYFDIKKFRRKKHRHKNLV